MIDDEDDQSGPGIFASPTFWLAGLLSIGFWTLIALGLLGHL